MSLPVNSMPCSAGVEPNALGQACSIRNPAPAIICVLGAAYLYSLQTPSLKVEPDGRVSGRRSQGQSKHRRTEACCSRCAPKFIVVAAEAISDTFSTMALSQPAF